MLGLRRLIKIIKITLKYRLDTFLNSQALPAPLRLLLRPLALLGTPDKSRGQRLREALEELGPIFIKFGQLISTRRDLIPPDIGDELIQLQDNVPAFDSAIAIDIIETALGQQVDNIFAEFDATPLASASVAQIHPATLKTGEQVVVKVIRPDIAKTIRQDITLLKTIAQLIYRFHPDGRRLRPIEVVTDYQQTILDELDLQREAANTSTLRRNFLDSNWVKVPEVYWDYTRNNVFVMERIDGIPVTDIDQLRAQNTDFKILAERGVEIFFTQVFRDNFFHADMHPGNIFVSRENPDDPSYISVDCAIIGSLSKSDQYYLARNLLAIFQRDYSLVAQLHVECGWVPPNTKEIDIESAIRSVCEPIFEKPLGEISFGQLLLYLFQIARRFDMEVQPSLVLLQKTLLNIEGMGRQLYPQLDLWDTAQPFLENWLKEQYSPASLLEQIKHQAPGWLVQLPQLPDKLFETLGRSQQLEHSQQRQERQIALLEKALQKPHDKPLIGTAMLLFFVSAYGIWHQSGLSIDNVPAYIWLAAAGGMLILLRS